MSITDPLETAETYTIVGGGAIGGTLAVHLTRAGVPARIVDVDAEHVDRINRDGLRIESHDGELSAAVPACVPDEGPARLGAVLLAVKSHLTESALDWIAPRLTEGGYVVSMQNGINEASIAARVGKQRTVSAFVDLFADVIAPGVIKDGGAGMIAIGEYQGGSSARVEKLVSDLHCWGAPTVSDNVDGYLWSKLAFGTMLAGTALQDEDMHVLIDGDRRMWSALVREVIGVADAEGVALESFDGFEPEHYRLGTPEAEWSASMDRLVTWLAGQVKKRSGVWRDLAVRQRKTEVPHRYEQLAAIAAENGLDLPGIQKLIALIRQLENGQAEMGPGLLGQLRDAVRTAEKGRTHD